MAFYLGSSRMAKYQAANQQVSWATAFDDADGFGVGSSMGMLLLDIFLYLALAWYLDQVLPSENGLQKPFYFLCSPSYWWSNHQRAEELPPPSQEAEHPPLVVQPLPAPLIGRGVALRGLAKTWGRRVAVHSLSLEMAPGEVTGLLGANGAGKTTTMSMLTGLVPPSSGDAVIDGWSIRTQMQQIRRSMGVCPQQDLLYADLTPADHLRLYGALKGLHGRPLEAALEQLLGLVLLGAKALTPSKNLSGGQKRKLCLAISLIGSAQTIFLDEPTSGIDPHSRRSIWALLREQRKGRTIVLTTHFLDEAEILSDRIAIMAEGRLRCIGSPLFLKSHFGTGYTLAVTKRAPGSFDSARLLQWVLAFVHGAYLVSESSREASFRLPGGDLAAFHSLFAALEVRLAELGIGEYGAIATTLEDVFLQINQETLQRLTPHETPPVVRDGEVSVAVLPPAAETSVGRPVMAPPTPGHSTGLDHTSHARLAAKQRAAAQDVPPSDPTDLEMVDINLDDKSQPTTKPTRCVPSQQLRVYGALLSKRRLTAQRDWCSTCCLIFFPVLLILLALILIGSRLSSDATADPLHLVPDDAFPSTDPPGIPRPVPLILPEGNAACSWAAEEWPGYDMSVRLPVSSNAFPEVAVNLSQQLLQTPSPTQPAAFAYSPNTSFGAALESLLNNHTWPANISFNTTNISFNTSNLSFNTSNISLDMDVASLLFNSTSTHALPTLVASLYSALAHNATAGALSISSSVQALPISRQNKAQQDAFTALFASILLQIPFAFVAAQFITPLVRERESGSKQSQFVAGARPFVYWMAHWTWDAAAFLLIEAATLLIFSLERSASAQFAASTETFFATALLLLLFGFAVVPLASAASFGFRTPSNGLICLIAFHFLTGFGLVVTDFILSTMETTMYVNDQLRILYLFFPAYCLGRGFFLLSTNQIFASFGVSVDVDALGGLVPGGSLYDFDALGAPLVFLSGEGIFFLALTVGLQLEDESVRQERQLIDGGDVGDAPLVLRHLRREFGAKVAVHDLCLRVQRGECFGFLGVNGAGKSTTFAMLTGAVIPTSGDATLHGLSILERQNELRRLMGYCPQADGIEAHLTGREHLRMYAKIRGVPPEGLEAEVTEMLADLDLVKFADKPAGTYSGGNKRKLCVGIALLGSPQLVLLDEPSSGMDAASKRFLWSVIKRRTANCCTVLTTHSMEECEALCGRVGVMVEGALRCLGPIQTLKSTYGQGYKLDLTLDMKHAQPERVVELLQTRIDGVELAELEPPSMVLNVPQRRAELSQLFALLAELRQGYHVLECSVTQNSLEQIFLGLASQA